MRSRRWPMRRIFSHHYGTIRPLLEGTDSDGYLIVAIFDNEHLTTHARLVPRSDSTATVIIGRHQRAHIQLHRDPTVALRHLLVRLSQHGGRRTISLRDLKTGQGFELEGHGRCKSTTADGPLLVSIGAYTLIFLPGSSQPWPVDADAAWARAITADVEDRRFASGPLSSTPAEPPIVEPNLCEVSQIHLNPGVAGLARMREGEPLPDDTIGLLTVGAGEHESVYPVTSDHLERGLLLGRYSRCDVGSWELRQSGVISRVHLLILRDGERILALDTASTNGTIIDGNPSSIAELGDEATIELGATSTVQWRRLRDAGDRVPLSQLLN